MDISIRTAESGMLWRIFRGETNKKGTADFLTSLGRDTYERSIAEAYATYSEPAGIGKMIPDSLLEVMNNDISKVTGIGDMFECGGIRFSASQIPKMNVRSFPEIKAVDNVMDFGKNKYFKYVSPDGTSHGLYTNDKGIGSIVSEYLRGTPYDPVMQRYADFWLYLMNKDPLYLGLSYTYDEIKNYLDEAGLTPGFVTIKMGDRQQTQYYTASEYEGPIQSKERYDDHYYHMTSSGYLFHDYAPGSVFQINGKEYVLSESHTLDVPYGEDIYNAKYPPHN